MKTLVRPRNIIFMIVSIAVLIMMINIIVDVHWSMTVAIPTFGTLQNRQIGESTKIFDRTGKVLLYDTTGTMRQVTVPFTEIPPNIVNATIAIEDHTFYSHKGINLISIVRSLIANIGSASFGEGGSTITQQVIKNTLLTKDKSLNRKIKEFVLALRIEKYYSKDQILETYLNEIPFGGNIYGVEEASREYFDKSAAGLSLSEAAYLAAIPKATTYFSPWGAHFSLLEERHNLVLTQMLKYNLISDEEYQKALKEKVIFAEQSTTNIKAPHFVFYVLDQLLKKYGAEKMKDEAFQVITTLDWNLQKESEKIIHDGALRNEKNFQASNAGLVAIDPKSGQILAMVGSRDYFDNSVDGQVNVTLAHRQPGSTFKPFAYATAFEKGYTPETILFDLQTQFSTACSPTDFSNTYPCYSPNNYDLKFRGPMSMRDALAQSINIVGVKTLYLAGIDDTINTAQALGITTLTDKSRYGLSLVLGGGEVTLLEMTAAYGAFANDGAMYPTTPLLSITDKSGVKLETYAEKSNQVLDKEVARTINDVLSDNTARAPEFGLDSPLQFKNTLVADKTGTTNDFRDAWIIGYTPEIVIGAWGGNNNNDPMVKKIAGFIIAPMWHQAMQKALERFPSTPFPLPENNTAVLPAPANGTLNTDLAFEIPEIQHWTNKDNPQTDPELIHWEYPVSLWLNQNLLTGK